MSSISTTKMSSKGQVVIPEDIRRKLGLKSGSRFMVVGDDDVIILKAISPPSLKEFDKIIQNVRVQAKEAGLTEQDIKEAVDDVRSSS